MQLLVDDCQHQLSLSVIANQQFVYSTYTCTWTHSDAHSSEVFQVLCYHVWPVDSVEIMTSLSSIVKVAFICRGVYFGLLFYSTEGSVLSTVDDHLPVVEVDDGYPSSLMADFQWLLKVSSSFNPDKPDSNRQLKQVNSHWCDPSDGIALHIPSRSALLIVQVIAVTGWLKHLNKAQGASTVNQENFSSGYFQQFLACCQKTKIRMNLKIFSVFRWSTTPRAVVCDRLQGQHSQWQVASSAVLVDGPPDHLVHCLCALLL